MSVKNSNDPIGNRTRDLPCSDCSYRKTVTGTLPAVLQTCRAS